MNELDLSKAIKYLKPTAQFSFSGTDYSTIIWDVLEGDAPSWAEIEAAHSQVKAAEDVARVEAASKREALLARLGITEEEASMLAQSL